MEPREIISKHLVLCQSVHDLLLEENTWLKTEKTPPKSEFLDRKQEILPQLEKSLEELRKLKPEYFSPFDDSKKLVNESHSKLLKIFYIDRENEDLLLKLTQSTERQSFNRFAPTPEEIDDIQGPTASEPPEDGQKGTEESTEPSDR